MNGALRKLSMIARGGDLGGTGGRPPQKFKVEGTAHALVPPNILRSSVDRVKNCVFLVRKWSYTTFDIVNIRKMWEKKGKIRRTRSMTKNEGHQKFLP